MKKLTTLLILLLFIATAGMAKSGRKDLSGYICVRGELRKEYKQNAPGTPVIIRNVLQMDLKNEHQSDIYYAVEINGIQECVSIEDIGSTVKLTQPETTQEFWQQVYLKTHLYEHFANRGYKHKLRREIDDECREYLEQLEEIAYKDDYMASYVQGIFAKLNAQSIIPERNENLNIRIIQSPEPEAYMLPNGSMLVSTGLICTLDSEDELAAIIANELAHFVLDHPVENIYRNERRAKRAAIWSGILATAAEVAYEVAYWDNNEKAHNVGFVADLASVASLLCIPAMDHLGMKYKMGQELSSDKLACELLAFKGYDKGALASALGKITGYYNLRQQEKDITRYGSIKNLLKRIEKLDKAPELNNRPYLKKTSDVVTFNAAMNYTNRRYIDAARLAQKNIDNRLATDHDYLILTKVEMELNNTEEKNKECLQLLDKAEELAGDSPNLDICKQRILLLMRMNKQIQASSTIRDYILLLERYKEQGIEGEELEWTQNEIDWAYQLQKKINRI